MGNNTYLGIIVGALLGAATVLGVQEYLANSSSESKSCLDASVFRDGGAYLRGRCPTKNGELVDISIIINQDAEVSARVNMGNNDFQMASIKPDQKEPNCFGFQGED